MREMKRVGRIFGRFAQKVQRVCQVREYDKEKGKDKNGNANKSMGRPQSGGRKVKAK